MNPETIKNQPCDVSKINLRTRMNGANKERTAFFTTTFNYGKAILKMFSIGSFTIDVNAWDEDGNLAPGIETVKFNIEFDHYALVFHRNAREVVRFVAENLHSWQAKPIEDNNFAVSFTALGVCAEGDSERLHKLLKDPGITITLEKSENGQEEL